MRNYRLIPVAALVAGLGLARAPAEAQLITLSSTMTAFCANASCSQLRFLLDIQYPAPIYVKFFEINTAGSWRFASLSSVVSAATGTDVTGHFGSTTYINGGGIQLYAIDPTTSPALEPVVITASTAATGSLSDLSNFTYRGEGCKSARCGYSDPPDIQFVGQTMSAPEPATSLLLLTGLVGIGGAVRRRRRERIGDTA